MGVWGTNIDTVFKFTVLSIMHILCTNKVFQGPVQVKLWVKRTGQLHISKCCRKGRFHLVLLQLWPEPPFLQIHWVRNIHRKSTCFLVLSQKKIVRSPPGAQCTTPQARRSCPASLLPGITCILYSVLHGICNLALQVAVIRNINLGLHVICNLTLQIALMRNINLG